MPGYMTASATGSLQQFFCPPAIIRLTTLSISLSDTSANARQVTHLFTAPSSLAQALRHLGAPHIYGIALSFAKQL